MPNPLDRFKTDLDPRHYAFERQCRGFYPPARRETPWDRWADRLLVVVCVAVIALIATGALR